MLRRIDAARPSRSVRCWPTSAMRMHQAQPRVATTCCSKVRRARLLDIDHGTYPLRHLEQLRGRQRRGRLGRRPGHAALRAGHHQGLHHAGGQRARSRPNSTSMDAPGTRRPPPVHCGPGARHRHRPGAALRLARCGGVEALDHHQRPVTGPVHHQARCAWMDPEPKSRPASATSLRGAATSTCCRSTPMRWRPASRSTKASPAGPRSTAGLTQWDQLPANARALSANACKQLVGTPIDMVSTGPDREHTILLRHPYQA